MAVIQRVPGRLREFGIIAGKDQTTVLKAGDGTGQAAQRRIALPCHQPDAVARALVVEGEAASRAAGLICPSDAKIAGQ